LFEFNEESAMEVAGNAGKKVLDTGIYDAEIITVSEAVASTGTKGVDISFKIDGAKYPNTVYGMWYEKANGDAIGFNMSKLNSLVGLTPSKKVSTYNKTIEIKGGTKVVKAWKELDNFKCKVVVKKVFGFYNGEVTEKNEIEAFLGTDGKTYAESVKGSEAKQFKYYSEKLQDSYDKDYKKAEADGELNAKGTAEEATEENSSDDGLL